jgi:two-component system chemotaxis sensor kinase CheA
VDLITTELQMAVMKTRMVQIAKVFNKLPRLVRDLSRELGKEIELEMFGEETELDKSIIEEINDPLVHILRNAADHGVESPEERAKKGKNPKGRSLSAPITKGIISPSRSPTTEKGSIPIRSKQRLWKKDSSLSNRRKRCPSARS